MIDIKIHKTQSSRLPETDLVNLAFGKTFSDHMFIADFIDGDWKNPEIIPFGKIEMSPSMSALHHGQSVFEGMKAYKTAEGKINLFRPLDNFTRLNSSATRMCMPQIPESIFINGLKELISIDRDWVPEMEGYSLYIRPIYFATDEAIGVKPSENYRLVIFTCPVGAYFKQPLRVLVETSFSRACEGGVGFAKAAGNYGAAMYPTKLAQEKGYHQIIWTDSSSHEFVEESGAMNLMFVADGKLLTPSLSQSKLAGITRDSLLKIARNWNIPVEERNISIREIFQAHENGQLEDAFGCGTAANIASIESIGYKGHNMVLPSQEKRKISIKLGNYLTSIKTGEVPDEFGWITTLE